MVNAGMVIDSASCVPGSSFFYACTLSGRMDSLIVIPDTGTAQARYRLNVSYSVDHETRYGLDCYNSNGSNEYAVVSTPGALDFFMTDSTEFQSYVAGQPFRAFEVDEDLASGAHSLDLPRPSDWFAVLSNDEQANLTEFADVTVRLYRQGAGISEANGPGGAVALRVSGSPCRGRMRIAARTGPVSVRDATGRTVFAAEVRGGVVDWDGVDLAGRAIAPGVYFVQAGSAATPVVWLGR
jgi:hypothetical protein